jgi:very-short-patch-repair endonuclease
MKGNVNSARRLRRNQTDAERMLWFRLRDRRLEGWKFRRQAPVDRFIVDFICADAKVIIELDGGQHSVQTQKDAERTAILESMGYLVLRFWNNDVLAKIEGVLETILHTLNRRASFPLTPTLSPMGRGGAA